MMAYLGGAVGDTVITKISRRPLLHLTLAVILALVVVSLLAVNTGYVSFNISHLGSFRLLVPSLQKDAEVEEMERLLQQRLSEFPEEESIFPTKNCTDNTAVSCIPQASCPQFDPSPAVRLYQILATVNRTAIQHYLPALTASAHTVESSYEYIFATAASSNHFDELQVLVRNVMSHVFPHVTNFTFVIYDMGLTQSQNVQIKQLCGCPVLQFPFPQLPAFVRNLQCYAWKPLIIQALMDKCDLLIWMDTSIRWPNNTVKIQDILTRGRQRGLQTGLNPVSSIALRTHNQTFRFYGDRPCQYDPYGEVSGGFGVYHNERFVRIAILEPWLSCALNTNCMCLPGVPMGACKMAAPREYAKCHRFDQSSLGIILSKLYTNRTSLLRLPHESIQVDRSVFTKWLRK